MRFQSRYFKVFLVLLIIEIGIATFISSGFIRHYLGDYLVVIMMYCFFMSFFNLKPIVSAWIVLILATLVEIGQFFNLLNLLNLAENKLAYIILGNVFSYGDLVAYLLGIITVMIVENKGRSRS